jgi:hypothetical protein
MKNGVGPMKVLLYSKVTGRAGGGAAGRKKIRNEELGMKN